MPIYMEDVFSDDFNNLMDRQLSLYKTLNDNNDEIMTIKYDIEKLVKKIELLDKNIDTISSSIVVNYNILSDRISKLEKTICDINKINEDISNMIISVQLNLIGKK